MKKNICVDLELLHPFSVNSGKTAIVGFGIFSKKTLITPFIFYVGIFFLTILAATGVSNAEENKPSAMQVHESVIENPSKPDARPVKLSQIKHRRMLRRLTVGNYRSRAEVNKIAEKLRQLGFETWINRLKEGYVVNAGAFSSESNLEQAVGRLEKAGLADKIIVAEVEKKLTKAIAPTKTNKVQSTARVAKTSAIQKTPSSLDGYVPKKEYVKLQQEVEILKAQMQLLLNKQAASTQEMKSAELQTSQATAYPSGGDRSQTKKNITIVEGSREEEAEESRRELDTFLRSQKVLYKRGDLSFEYNLSYAQDTTVNTFGFPDSTSRLNTTAKLITRAVQTSLGIRYGLADNLEVNLNVPYGYFEQNNDNQPFNINSAPVSHTNASGIGDIGGALRYAALTEKGNIPDVTLTLNTQAPTGDWRRGLGTGFWQIGGEVSLVKTIDPVVFFGSLGYTAVLEDRGVDPGNQVSYSIGAGYSMNDRVSFTTSLSGGIATRIEENGFERPGSALDIHALQFSSTIQLSKRLFVEPFVGFGLTDDAPDFIVGLRVPYRLEQRYPLPFFSD